MAASTRSKTAERKRRQQAEGSAQERDRSPAPSNLHADVLALQRSVGNRAVDGLLAVTGEQAPPIVAEALKSGGQPLDPATRSFMEDRFGEDFSQVRVHTDARAAESAEAVNALAYTVGRDVVFGEGQYAPSTSEGRKLMAHELTHVTQQPITQIGLESKFVMNEPNTADERNAELLANDVVLGNQMDRTALSGAKIQNQGIQMKQKGAGKLREVKRKVPQMKALQKGIGELREAEWQAEDTGTPEIVAARTNFESNNKHLSPTELAKIVDGIKVVTVNNPKLQLAFYNYYSDHKIAKADKETPDAGTARDAETAIELAHTSGGGDTVVSPSVLDPGFSDTTLGTLLIHEFSHTHHMSGALGTADYLEGESYGIEYFFAKRVGDRERANRILIIMGGGYPHKTTITADQAQLYKAQMLFKTSYATLVGLYEVIDMGRSPRSSTPFTTLTRDQAHALVTELVSRGADYGSPRLLKILKWVESNLATFTFPAKFYTKYGEQ